MMKFFLAMIMSVSIMTIAMPGVTLANTDRVPDEEACKSVGGTWRTIIASYGVNNCEMAGDIKTEAACKKADGVWITSSTAPGGGSLPAYCQPQYTRPDSSNNAGTSGAKCAILPGSVFGSCGEDAGASSGKIEDTTVWKIVTWVIQILTGLIGVVALAGVIYGSVMYASAGGSAEQVKKARNIILNVVIGVAAYALLFSLLNWLLPINIFS